MTRVGQFLFRILDLVTKLSSALAAIGLAMIVGSYVYEVISRYVFNSPTAWASDFVAYALCATVFLALPRVSKERTHVAVTILVDVIPKPIADVVHMIVCLLGFCSLLFAAWISLQENIRQYTRGIETLAMVPIPLWWVSSFVTFGLAVSAFYFLVHLPPRYRAETTAEAE